MKKHEDVWARIGLLLAVLQHVEHTINASLGWVFHDQPVTLEQIALFEKSKQRKTLGVLLRALRERIKIDRGSDRFLKRFLDDRNRFIHRLFTERGYDINNSKDIRKIRKFVDSLTDRCTIVLAAFHAFIDVWTDEHDLKRKDDIEWPPKMTAMIDRFKQRYLRDRRGR
jgi:hypothetical protein